MLAPLVSDPLGLLLSNTALAQEVVQVGFSNRFAPLDSLIQQRLREAGIVSFIMAPAPVAVHIDHDVALIFVSKVKRKSDNLGRCFRVFSVNVQDGHLQHLRYATGVDC